LGFFLGETFSEIPNGVFSDFFCLGGQKYLDVGPYQFPYASPSCRSIQKKTAAVEMSSMDGSYCINIAAKVFLIGVCDSYP